jgi:hypothetical protein
MAQRTLKRILTGGALMAALTLTTPAPAHAAGLNTENLWNWLSSFWAGPTSATVSGHTLVRRHSPGTGPWDKIGAGIDPNGCTGTQPAGSSGSPCTAGSNIGPVIDPNS